LAARTGLAGWVRNEAGAVRIVVEGIAADLQHFLVDLERQAPPLARIDHLTVAPRALTGNRDFRIVESLTDPTGRLPVSPDIGLCGACERELYDPSDRRYGYPFITCTDCGPRFTVIESMPYDRERSTMASFRQCAECLAEYDRPTDRRYHSETNSCPRCGPSLWWHEGAREIRLGSGDALERSATMLRSGGIVAIRGLGGFHLACDAGNEEAVRRLRRRKRRESKPLAVMVRSLEDAKRLAVIDRFEAEHLMSPERPLVLLQRRDDSELLASSVAPALGSVAVMLAYTPLHHLLLEAVERPVVMTSGNVSEEPIATGNQEALDRLARLADGFLLHDREIVARYDDSLLRVARNQPLFMRRARGYAPLPLSLPVPSPRPLLAVGPHLKNTFTLADGGVAFVSQHIGDLENLETLEHYQQSLARFRTLFRIRERVAVRDLHPGYLSTRIAEELDCEQIVAVQHHHAHVAAVLAEHGRTDTVLGVTFDGTGFGEDGTVWGGEFLLADLRQSRRVAHLRPAPLPGGELAIRSPWRVALGYASPESEAVSTVVRGLHGIAEEEREIALRQACLGINAPLASSMGRLFDAAAAVLGVRLEQSYEGQAAMELESLAGARAGASLPFPMTQDGQRMAVLDPLPLLLALAEGVHRGDSVPDLAASFHDTVAAATVALAMDLAADAGVASVAVGGGCFQNRRLLETVVDGLESRGLTVLSPRRLSPNDGCISFGQAAVAAARLHDAQEA
jgi:hydrogenase maturation protein HypF